MGSNYSRKADKACLILQNIKMNIYDRDLCYHHITTLPRLPADQFISLYRYNDIDDDYERYHQMMLEIDYYLQEKRLSVVILLPIML